MMVIPSKEDWGDYKKDLDSESAFKSFFGKSNADMQSKFFKDGTELMTEIRFMPPRAFEYYIIGFRDFILADKFPCYEASDFTSYFLDMVEYMLINNTSLVSSSMPELMPALEIVAKNQEKYEAPFDIYGDFNDKLSSIIGLCEKSSIRVK